jgi:hypothetical protein
MNTLFPLFWNGVDECNLHNKERERAFFALPYIAYIISASLGVGVGLMSAFYG